MSFLRNHEVKRDLVIWLILFIAFTAGGFALDRNTGLLVSACSLISGGLHFTVTYVRYTKITKLSRDLDALLHGDPHIKFENYREGELSILQNELGKMTLRLREQAEALTNDKLLLIDSTADISHQLRTPLTSMNLILSRLEEPELDPRQRLRLVKDAERLVSRIDWLVSSLLKISKLDADTVKFRKEPVLLREVIRQGSDPLLIPMELRQQNFTVKIEEDASFLGDLSWSKEAVGNVLKNCMEHTPVGGTISVEGSENPLFAEIIVSDTGCGIDPEDLPHLFERFYKGKDASEQSVGIGLALSRMIITKQNGTIKAENIPTGGAKFTIRFYKGAI